ncbi:MAG: CBS domain-containing protein [Nitrososphaerota archaeon]|nr:CBS domain-containing protein [Nitrososphaerota archaeon]MDG6967066.1 CBS domain-containing protein [Nitrososphaerota archaeon]MDG6979077.1 CBS domain-containing protein [Nitrososphaerota archaeon]MDG7006102.1 CBS domain-containing protein [Nitrososphaerota archaeon]MDG7021625.1 CBS domain-containing protein [Nitrososphaerota archaeon]
MEEEPGLGAIRVKDIMVTDVHAVGVGTSVKETAAIMAREGHGCVIVVDRGIAVGIVTERDIVRKVTGEGVDPSRVRVQDIMSTPLITVSPSATVLEAAEMMSEYEVRRTVVVDDEGRLVGLLAAGDIARWLAQQKNYEDAALNAIARLKTSSTGGPYR